MNQRIERLRKRYVAGARKVDVERAVIITEAYRNNEDKPPIIAKALALEAIDPASDGVKCPGCAKMN